MYFNIVIGLSEIPTDAKIILREAVRGVVLNNQHMALMIHTANGDYKFPGGGLEKGERFSDALSREFIEETGYVISNRIQPIGLIIEQKEDSYESKAYFVMKSYYYLCEITGENIGQKLDEYEKKLCFKPEFVSLLDACEQNKKLLRDSNISLTPWVQREIIALENIIEAIN